jgi:hypothetical protein
MLEISKLSITVLFILFACKDQCIVIEFGISDDPPALLKA